MKRPASKIKRRVPRKSETRAETSTVTWPSEAEQTLAALRAHETRNHKAGKEEAANVFAARIAEILKGVQPAIEHKKEAQA